MNKIIVIVQLIVLIILSSSFQNTEENSFALTVEVDDLRNSNGMVQFTLYNYEGSLPDEHYKKYYRKLTATITNGTSQVTFENLTPGKYAINILHDENEDGKIKKGFILPTEGIGFSNYQTIGLSNRPAFEKASFNLSGNKKINIKIIYL